MLAGGRAVRGDWLLVHAAATYVSLAVIRDGHLIFYRTRGEESEGSIADLVHQTAMYYEDRLSGQRFDGVLLAGGSTAAGADHLRQRVVRTARPRGRLGRSVPGRVADAWAARRPRWPTCWRRRSACWCAQGTGALAVLRGNLATRPFYNERLVRVLLAAALAAAAAWTAVNVANLVSLSQQGAMLAERCAAPGSPPRRRGGKRRRCAPRSTRPRSPPLPGRPAEANQLIAQRTFSWTTLFNRVEATLPPDVRLVQVQPQADDAAR